MKKTSIIVHQNYAEDVIKNLHETGLMEIIDISKEEPETLEDAEKAHMHPDASICTNYELRLSRLIDILKKITPKKSGIKAFFNPELPEIKTIEDRPLEEIYSYIEGLLDKIENNILENEQKLQELDQRKERINLDIEQLNYLIDFELDISDIGESEYVIVKTGRTSDLEDLKTQLQNLDTSALFSKQLKRQSNTLRL